MLKEMEAHWGGAQMLIGVLYGIWSASYFYASDTGLHSGGGILLSYVLVPLVFCVGLAVSAGLVNLVFQLIRSSGSRLCFIIAGLVLFVIGYGRPSIIVYLVSFSAFGFGYLQQAKTRKDNKALQNFLDK